MTLVLTTLDWVPDFPRGYVRDLRIRWAPEEARLTYRIATTPFDDSEARLPFQPFAQVPWLTDGEVTVFETGAILLYLAERSDVLIPTDRQGHAKVMAWLFAALNSVEMPAVPGRSINGRMTTPNHLATLTSNVSSRVVSIIWKPSSSIRSGSTALFLSQTLPWQMCCANCRTTACSKIDPPAEPTFPVRPLDLPS